MPDELKTELNKMLMNMYEKGLNDGTKSVKLAIDVAVSVERNRCIDIIENYQIHVGASTAGEIACEMAYMALRDIRNQINGEVDDE